MGTSTKSIILVAILFFLLFSSSISSRQQFLKVIKHYLPEEDTPFFKIANDVEIIDDLILVLENIKNHVLSYSINNSDRLIFKGFFIGKGQGPGETVLPTQMSVWDDKLTIIDSLGCSIFSKEGKFLNKFRIFTGKISFVFTANKIYIASKNPNSSFLIDVYSLEGKKLFQFGENLLPVDYEINKNLNRGFVKSIFYNGKLVADAGKIYFFSNLFGKVFVFDLEGKNLETKNIASYFDPQISTKNLEGNNNMIKNGIKPVKYENGSQGVSYFNFFDDIYLCNNKIYILNSMSESKARPHITIRVLDKDSLELINTLLIKKNSDEDMIRCLAVKEENGKVVIIAAMETMEGTEIAKFME